MHIYLILEISILFLITALIIAVWLIKVTGNKRAWVILAAALAVMAGRQIYILYSLSKGGSAAIDPTGELIGMFASLFMAAGMALTVPLIQSIKRSEELQIDINRSLRMFTLSNEAIITATDEFTLLQYICRVIHEVGKFRFVWIEYRERGVKGAVRTVAQSGLDEGGRKVSIFSASETAYGISPVNTALRSCKPAICNNTLEDPAFEPWRNEAEELGIRSLINIPLVLDNQGFGVLNICSEKPDSFTISEVKLLQEMTDDLVYGIKSLRAMEEHKRIEEELARSEKRVRASIENMPDAFSIYSAVRDEMGVIKDFRIEYVNAAACGICGMESGELAKGHLLAVFPDYRETGLFDEYCKVVETGLPLIINKWTVDSQGVTKEDGKTRVYNIRAVRLEDGLVVAWRDITDIERAAEALRASEARYLTIFNTASVPICVEDFSEVKKELNSLKSCGITDLRRYMDDHPEFEQNILKKIRIQDVNEAAIKLYEAERKEELLSSLENIFLSESSPLLREMLLAILEEREFFEGETVNRTLKGKKLKVWIRITIPGNDSEFENLLVSILDVTEHRKMEEELLKAQKIESLGVLAGGIAHDFNNMLTVILGNIVLAKMKLNKDDDVYVRLDKTENAINRAMELTRNLLTFSKVQELSVKTMEIGELVRETASFALSGSKSKCIFSIPQDLLPVQIDEGQIRQVIENLVINADQAMPKGGEVSVTCENLDTCPQEISTATEMRCVKISVADHGKGISPEIRGKIFDPYFSTKEGKSGLGLATSYSIISKHGGQLTEESREGGGSVFSIFLPVGEEGIRPRQIGRKALEECRRVLVMDDEKDVREVAEGVLKIIGCETTQARDGEEALELYLKAGEEGRPFDVVILDLTVSGGMGGKETIRRLLEIDRNVNAIVSTGYLNDPVMSDYMQYGFKGALNKPYNLQELKEVLSQVFSRDI